MVNKLTRSSTKIKTLLLLSLAGLLSACDNDNKPMKEKGLLPTQETEMISVETTSTKLASDQSHVTEEKLDSITDENKKLQDRIKQLKTELEKNSLKNASN